MESTDNIFCCTQLNGGVSRVSLARASWIKNVTLCPARKSCTAITLDDGKSFETCTFGEDTALLREEAALDGGSTLIVHELQMVFTPANSSSALKVEQLCGHSPREGLVALVETFGGERLLLGYSPHFGTERPLCLHSSKSTTGSTKADNPQRVVTLRSVDTSPAMSYPTIQL